MSTALATRGRAEILEEVIVGGDLSKLTPEQRVSYYGQVCQSVGLNPLTKPFEYIRLNGRVVLYARKDATDQLRSLRDVSLDKPEVRFEEDMILVTISGRIGDRTDTEIGVVSLTGLKGNDRANAIMKAHTKAKRRLTLSLCGLGWLDETELDTIPNAQPVTVDTETGQILDGPKPEPRRNGNGNGKADRPADPETVRGWMRGRAMQLAARPGGVEVTLGERGATVAALEALFREGDATAQRHELLRFFFGLASIKDLSDSQVRSLNLWAQDRLDTGEYVPNPDAMVEAAAILEGLDSEAEPEAELGIGRDGGRG